MLDAYSAETADVGTWAQIGNTAPGERDNESQYHSKEFTCKGAKETWTAHNDNKLNDCSTGDNWVLTAKAAKSADTENGVMAIEVTTKNREGLTPSFAALARSSQ